MKMVEFGHYTCDSPNVFLTKVTVLTLAGFPFQPQALLLDVLANRRVYPVGIGTGVCNQMKVEIVNKNHILIR